MRKDAYLKWARNLTVLRVGEKVVTQQQCHVIRAAHVYWVMGRWLERRIDQERST